MLYAVIIILLIISPWPNGMNSPLWTGLLFSLSSAALAIFFLKKRSVDPIIPLAAIGYITACLWAAIQILPIGVEDIAHQNWARLNSQPPAPISASPGLTFDGLAKLLSYGALFLIAAYLGKDPTKAQRIITIAAIACAAAGLSGLAIYSGIEFNFMNQVGDAAQGRLSGPFTNPNIFAAYLTQGLTISLGFLTFSKHAFITSNKRFIKLLVNTSELLHKNTFALAGFTLISSALLLTGSRGGVIAALSGIGLLYLLKSLTSKARQTSSILGVIALICAVFFLNSTSSHILSDRLDTNSLWDQDGRQEVHQLTLSMMKSEMLLGHGLNSFQDSAPGYETENNLTNRRVPHLYAHSTYLEFIAGMGAPAAGLFIASIIIVLARCLNGFITRRSLYKRYPAIALASAAALGAHAFVDDPFLIPAVAATFSIILGVGVAQSKSSQAV